MRDIDYIEQTMDRTMEEIRAERSLNSALLVFYAALITIAIQVGPYLE